MATTPTDEIRARWAALDWAYVEERMSESYVAEARLDQLQQDGSTLTLLDLDEPSADEQALLDRVARAPQDVRDLLALAEEAGKARHAAIERTLHTVRRGLHYQAMYVRLATAARASLSGPGAIADQRLADLLESGAEEHIPLLDLLDAARGWARAIREVDGVAAAEQRLQAAIEELDK